MRAALGIAILLPAIAFAEIQILAITSSTDFQRAAIAPGSLESIWCTGLTDINGVVSATGPILPTQLAGVSVYAGGAMNAPILAVAELGGYQLINIQVPWDAAGFNVVTVIQGSQRATATVTAGTTWPVFFVNPAGYMIAVHASNFELVTPENPAEPGEWIAGFASNLGPVTNPPPSGVVAPLDSISPLAPVASSNYAVAIGLSETQVAESNFMGLAPGTVGVYQINFWIPETSPTGDVTVYIRKTVDCGFFFVQGCGRGVVSTFSNGAKISVGR